jgi:hypothetical protein
VKPCAGFRRCCWQESFNQGQALEQGRGIDHHGCGIGPVHAACVRQYCGIPWR